jgi:hypothetical protein
MVHPAGELPIRSADVHEMAELVSVQLLMQYVDFARL